jgi:predicted lipoprotein with Yx(FWY)xxD motif
MHRRIIVGTAALGIGAIALAACGSAGGTSSDASPRAHQMSGTRDGSVSTPATIGLASNSTIGQQLLVDSTGKTIYYFVPDGTSTQSMVPTQFKPNWPPVTSMGTPSAGSGLDATKIGVQTQSDGTRQVTYNGHLLYTFINDMAPGDTNGQGLGPNNWFVLDANGNAIGLPRQVAVPATSTPGMSPSDGMGWKGW